MNVPAPVSGTAKLRRRLAACRDRAVPWLLRAIGYSDGRYAVPGGTVNEQVAHYQQKQAALHQEISIRDAELFWHRHPGFMHYPVGISVAPPCILPPNELSPRTRRAAERITEAWHRSKSDAQQAAPSLWDTAMYRYYAEFILALELRQVHKVEETLNAMFRSTVSWGTARMHWSWPEQMLADPHSHYCLTKCSDVLYSLGEAVGVKVMPSIEQHGGWGGFCNTLKVDLSALVHAIEQTAGLDLSFPSCGGPMGVNINEKLLTIDSILHSYSVYRMRELGAQDGDRIVEIGGGYGCMAYLMYRAGFRDLEIIDLPWQNAIQGFFLMNSLPEDAVCLYGETGAGSVKVMPPWAFARHVDRSVDYVINVNSMPEIGLDDARDYVRTIGRVVRKTFVSMNHESGQANLGVGPRGPVHKLAEMGRLRRVSRGIWWMEQGYVEELYQPLDAVSQAGTPGAPILRAA